ncbi:MAG: RNA polymerase sigma factor [Thermoguttaceae bacterium]
MTSDNPAGASPSDEELARRAQQGCRASLDQLLRRFQRRVLHFLQQRVGPRDAEDLAQETFLRAYEQLHRYRGRWPFTAWLFTIARRTAINHHRRRRPAGGAEDLAAVESSAPGPATGTMAAESGGRLWATAAAVLSEEQFTALWLHYVEDTPMREIAWILGSSRVAVKTMIFRARKKLLPLLQDPEENREPRPPRTARHEEASAAAAMEAPYVP